MTAVRPCLPVLAVLACLLPLAPSPSAQVAFVNWETPHVHPLDLTADGARLLAVNTPDDRLEVFDTTGPAPVRVAAVPVGVDPVSVRARTNTEAWVVNHISDSVSIVDLVTGRVTATLATDDEPADVIFAGNPQRAFVSCSQVNIVMVFDPANLSAPPVRIPIQGEDPRALATNALCDVVYVAVFESGNGSTILGGGMDNPAIFNPPNVVSLPFTPHGGANPPPNDGANFNPPINPALPPPPRVSLIAKQNEQGAWMDDNGGDWTEFVSGPNALMSGRLPGWTLLDHDIAVIDPATLQVTSYVDKLMNINMAMSVHPSNGQLAVVGTDATNEVRFEPVLQGTFTRVNLALVNVPAATKTVVDLNDHLDYSVPTVAQNVRNRSLGDPRGIAWNLGGTRAYVTGMGSNNVVVIDSLGNRAGLAPTIEVGAGPTGIVAHHTANRLYVLNKFAATVSVIDMASELETDVVPFHNPEPRKLGLGRRHLYSTHDTSGLGQIACGSCHVDARMDRLAWDLGNPAADMKVLNQNLGAGIPGLTEQFEDWHPMKGPMLTQTLQDIIGKEPLHWRGDKDGLEEFNGAFTGLQGDDVQLTQTQMQEFEDFLATIHYPPNPFREFDNSLPADLPLPGHYTTERFGPFGLPLPNGDAQRGLALFIPPNFLDGIACVTCHTLPTGLGPDAEWDGAIYQDIPAGPMKERHHALTNGDNSTNKATKISHLRNLYERTGFVTTRTVNTAGFGYFHDGGIASIEQFVASPPFSVQSDQDVADLTAFLLAFSGSDLPNGSPSNLNFPPGTSSQDTHAAVGAQTTLVDAGTATPSQLQLLGSMRTLADAGVVGLIAKGRFNDVTRGYAFLGSNTWQSDRAVEVITTAQLHSRAEPGEEITFTIVPAGTEIRAGIDRDKDGAFDFDEVAAQASPTDPGDTPGPCGQPNPTAPSGLTATPRSDALIELTWTDNSFAEHTFVVRRALSGTGNYEIVADLPADTTTFTDIGLDCATAYDYRVHARGCGGFSGPADASATTDSCDGPWIDLGSAFPGTHGDPVLTVTGPLFPHTPISIQLTNALEGALAYFVVGIQELNADFFGGNLVPDFTPPGFSIALPTNGAGSITIQELWPAGFPSGFDIYFQYWIIDAGAPFGFAGSNAVQGTTP